MRSHTSGLAAIGVGNGAVDRDENGVDRAANRGRKTQQGSKNSARLHIARSEFLFPVSQATCSVSPLSTTGRVVKHPCLISHVDLFLVLQGGG